MKKCLCFVLCFLLMSCANQEFVAPNAHPQYEEMAKEYKIDDLSAQTISIQLTIQSYSQEDELWMNERLGNCSDKTIKEDQGIVTSLTMIYNYLFGKQFNPLELNEKLSDACEINLIEAANSLDMIYATGEVKEISEKDFYSVVLLNMELGLPVLVGLENETKQYMVVSGIDSKENKIRIEDPIQHKEYLSDYTDQGWKITEYHVYMEECE